MGKYEYKVTDGCGGSCAVPFRSPFYLKYEKGKRVKAVKGSLGIMVFPTRELALGFMITGRQIKRVVPVGKATVPTKVLKWIKLGESLETFNALTPSERDCSRMCIAPPKGTVCYPEVIVVD